jgi:hypothetical protein
MSDRVCRFIMDIEEHEPISSVFSGRTKVRNGHPGRYGQLSCSASHGDRTVNMKLRRFDIALEKIQFDLKSK